MTLVQLMKQLNTEIVNKIITTAGKLHYDALLIEIFCQAK